MADAITENADKLAAAVGANKQTAESIIHNALAIANVVVSQSAQNGANSAKFEQLREVIATETEARVTDVTRLEAKVTGNEAGITEVRQALATETEARATAVDELTAKTGDNAAGVTLLTQAVTTLDSSTTSRFEELSGKTDNASGGIQNTSIALIQNTLAQVNQSQRMSVQYGDSKAGIQRVDNVMADASKAVAESLKTLDSSAAGGSSNVTDFSKTMADFSQVAATRINSLSVSMNGQTAAITELYNAQIDTAGKLNAMYNIKVAVDSNGRQYAAGMGIGVENTPGGMQSQVLFLADRFAVMSQAGGAVTLPFVIENGQAFFNDAFFKNASIDFGKITDSLQSGGYQAGKAGWNIPKNGPAEFNDSLVINGSGNKIKVDGTGLDVNVPGVVRIHVGVW
ncbi:phage tail tip fiber protein [Buttiauxella gaviniae]